MLPMPKGTLTREVSTTNSQITVIDQGTTGGRLRTARGTDDRHYELGAARFHPRRHATFAALLAVLGLGDVPFNFDRRHDVRVHSDEIRRFSDVDIDYTADHDGSFVEALSERMLPERAARFCRLTGYGALVDESFPAKGGHDVSTSHPESFASPEDFGPWRAPESGFQDVAESYRDRIEAAGIRIHREHEVRSITTSGQSHHLSAHQLDGSLRTFTARSGVFLAVPPSAIRRMRTGSPVLASLASDFRSVPINKTFLKFDEVWWTPDAASESCFISLSPLQKLYLDGAGQKVYSFCDTHSAIHCHAQSSDPGTLNDFMRRSITETVGLDLARLPPSTVVANHFWPDGIEYLPVGAGDKPLGFASDGRLYHLADGFTQHIGWIEGALVSARAAVASALR